MDLTSILNRNEDSSVQKTESIYRSSPPRNQTLPLNSDTNMTDVISNAITSPLTAHKGHTHVFPACSNDLSASSGTGNTHSRSNSETHSKPEAVSTKGETDTHSPDSTSITENEYSTNYDYTTRVDTSQTPAAQSFSAPGESENQPLKQFSCITCSRNFSRRSDLVRHERIHTGIKPNVCGLCGKQFIQRSALTVHMRVHTGDKPHKCDICDKAFSDSSSLARHRRVHTGKRPYMCEYPGCKKTFTRRTTLTRHFSGHTSQYDTGNDSGTKSDAFYSDSSSNQPSATPNPSQEHQDSNKNNNNNTLSTTKIAFNELDNDSSEYLANASDLDYQQHSTPSLTPKSHNNASPSKQSPPLSDNTATQASGIMTL